MPQYWDRYVHLIVAAAASAVLTNTAHAQCANKAALSQRLLGTWQPSLASGAKFCFTYGFKAGGKFEQIAKGCPDKSSDGIGEGTWTIDDSCKLLIVRAGGNTEPAFAITFMNNNKFTRTARINQAGKTATVIFQRR